MNLFDHTHSRLEAFCASEQKQICRETYGSDRAVQPNEYCYWDGDKGLWHESDAHLRERMNKVINKP